MSTAIPQRLVILGGTGFVGHQLLPRLAADGHELILLSRNRERQRGLAVLPRTNVRNADPYDRDSLRRHLAGADAVINLIGILNPSGKQDFRHVHVELVRGLIEACHEAGVRRLHQMSALKAGQGLSRYLKSRGEAEVRVKQSGLAWTIYQPSVIFGAGDGLVSRFARLLRLPILPLARPTAKLAPTWVGDVSEAIARSVALGLDAPSRTYELYGPQVLSLREIVGQIRDAAGRHSLIVGLPDPLGKLQARLAEWIPGKPFSLDNFLSLRTDAVGKLDGYAALGITPQPFSAWLPRLLGKDPRQPRLDLARSQRR